MTLENKIDYREVIEMIKNEIYAVIQDNIENGDGAYEDLNILISNEQFFIKKREEGELSPNTIYIVVKFMSAAVDYGVTVLPVSIIAISEQNHSDLCQRLLQDFVTTANMETNNTATIQQFYESPVVSSNFNEMFEGFRSIIACSGTFVISERANPFTLYWYNEDAQEWQEVYFINGNIGANFQAEPKLFYDSNNYTRSIDVMGTVTFNISSILLKDNGFYDEMLKHITRKNNYTIDTNPSSPTYLQKIEQTSYEPIDVNRNIILKLVFRSNEQLIDFFKLANQDIQQVLKKIPMITLVFTN